MSVLCSLLTEVETIVLIDNVSFQKDFAQCETS